METEGLHVFRNPAFSPFTPFFRYKTDPVYTFFLDAAICRHTAPHKALWRRILLPDGQKQGQDATYRFVSLYWTGETTHFSRRGRSTSAVGLYYTSQGTQRSTLQGTIMSVTNTMNTCRLFYVHPTHPSFNDTTPKKKLKLHLNISYKNTWPQVTPSLELNRWAVLALTSESSFKTCMNIIKTRAKRFFFSENPMLITLLFSKQHNLSCFYYLS